MAHNSFNYISCSFSASCTHTSCDTATHMSFKTHISHDLLGLLDVQEETVTDSAPIGSPEELQLADAKVYIAGIPQTFDAER